MAISQVRDRVALAVIVGLMALSLAGCAKKAEQPAATPKVKPPAVGEAGKLRAGVDLSTPPFGGTDTGRKAGIDIDVAAAIADKLGLTVTYVDVQPSEAATALAEGKVDVVMSVPVAGADLTRLAPAGVYMTDGPAAFVATEGTASIDPTMTIATLPGSNIAVQTESEGYWRVAEEYGVESLTPFDSLRKALEAVKNGEAKVAVGDAFVGAYIARDIPEIKMAGQIGPASQLSVGVGAENTALADAVRNALDELAADGVLDSVRTKWVGKLPKLDSAKDALSSAGDANTP